MRNHDPLCPDRVSSVAEGCLICETIAKTRLDERDKLSGSAVWQVTLDEETNTAYLWTTPEETFSPSSNGLMIQRDAYLDIDARGCVTGIEIFDWPGGRQVHTTHKFEMESDSEMCRHCGSLLDSVVHDGIHWFTKEGDNG